MKGKNWVTKTEKANKRLRKYLQQYNEGFFKKWVHKIKNRIVKTQLSSA